MAVGGVLLLHAAQNGFLFKFIVMHRWGVRLHPPTMIQCCNWDRQRVCTDTVRVAVSVSAS